MTKFNQKKIAKLITALILVCIGSYHQFKDKPSDPSLVQVGYYDVVSIADGDTITVDVEGKKERIRLIGVDTPEIYHGGSTAPSQCYGEKAKAFTEAAIDNKRVKLVADEKGSNRDRYGRLLRYVYTSDNRDLDELLVAEGYGFAVTGFSYTRKDELQKVQDDAEAGKKGLWAVCEVDRSKSYLQVAN